MVRAWGRLVQSAAQLWAVLPPTSLAGPSGPDLMVRLHGLGEGIARSAGHWPGPGRQDQRPAEIVRNLSRARELIARCGPDVQPTVSRRGPTLPVPAPASCTRCMWALTLQLLRSGSTRRTFVAALRVETRRRRPIGLRPDVREIQAAEDMLSRFEVFEQLAAGYVAAHPVTATVLGEVRPIPPASRLQSALAAWDIQVH